MRHYVAGPGGLPIERLSAAGGGRTLEPAGPPWPPAPPAPGRKHERPLPPRLRGRSGRGRAGCYMSIFRHKLLAGLLLPAGACRRPDPRPAFRSAGLRPSAAPARLRSAPAGGRRSAPTPSARPATARPVSVTSLVRGSSNREHKPRAGFRERARVRLYISRW